jgi:hypothetical protein
MVVVKQESIATLILFSSSLAYAHTIPAIIEKSSSDKLVAVDKKVKLVGIFKDLRKIVAMDNNSQQQLITAYSNRVCNKRFRFWHDSKE